MRELPVSMRLAQRRLVTSAELCLYDGPGPVNSVGPQCPEVLAGIEHCASQVHSGSASKPTLAHGSTAGSPATTSVNQESSTQAKCLSSPPSVIDEGCSATRNWSSLNPRHFHSSVAR